MSRLLERLQSVLGASNVRTASEVGGGEMDIVYLDTMTAELKVERTTPASFPTLVGVVIVSGDPLLPSAWSGTTVDVE